MIITVKAAAKINLMLDILQKLNNGYHSLWMIMQSVDLYDVVTVEQLAKGIELTCSEPELPTDRKNIAYKAAEEFFKFCNIKGGAKIHIDKKIPFAAGMAGGSADAAAVIVALDKIYSTALSVKQFTKLGLKVGADVPFCIQGGTMLVQDIGGVLSPLPDLPDCYFVISKPEQSVSTAQAYGTFDECTKNSRCRHTDQSGMLRAIIDEDLSTVGKTLGNVFEQFVEVHERVPIKSVMRKYACLGCCMSGSGPTVFGIFDKKKNADACAKELKTFIKDTFVCKPINQGSEIKES
ncbi:MAG: 4-(cytidine 5'-diphospho)-2-C-methyl-D-erythritol kinase [Clostridiales bacterium]|nr:4-(cytidine 5'-diphospho)-2-C-methyl-D-erythritol kinase [Clostridiales bacterium]